MNDIFIQNNIQRPDTISMKDMKPGQIAMILSNICKNEIVRRTCSSEYFQVEILSKPEINACWVKTDMDIEVKLLPNAYITVTVE